MVDVNRMLAPTGGLTIRQPTDSGLAKGNIQNPPRFTNLGMGGLNSAGAEGLEATPFGQTEVASTIRKNVHIKGSR